LRHLCFTPLAIFGLALFQLGLSRGQEFTADRYGLHGSRNLAAAERALKVLLAGRLAVGADTDAIEAQWRRVGLVGRLAELTSTHPNLPRRIGELRAYAREMRLEYAIPVAA
jgi:Zn-dependent protease with chaperone function